MTTTNDIARTHSGLKGFLYRRLETPNVSAANEDIISSSLDYLMNLDLIHLNLEQLKTFERMLEDITDVYELEESHHFRKQASGSRKQAMRAYYRKHKLQILSKRAKLKRHISLQKKQKTGNQ